MWTVLLLMQAGTAPHQEVCPEPVVPPVKKRKPIADTQLPQHCGSLLGSLVGISRKHKGLNHWESDCDGEGGRARTTRTRILTDSVHACSTLVVVPMTAAALFTCRARWHGLSRECNIKW